MRTLWIKFRQSNTLLWLVYSLAAVLIAVQQLNLGRRADGYTNYENYLIFKNSFTHLLQGLNPYQAFPVEQWDLYKYSPAFALFMAPFSYMPDWMGLPLWNLLNALTLLSGILFLPLEISKKRFLAWFVLIELITSMQNSQSNGLTAALILWVWIALENARIRRAGLWIASGAFLKIFGAFALLPAVLYPGWQRTTLWTALAALAFTLLPAVATGLPHLLQVYEWWWELLIADHQASIGLSVAGWLESWFGWMPPKSAVTATGLLLLLVSIGTVWRNGGQDKTAVVKIWASLLIWVVIFNHKAESPTFVIALTGVGLWYLAQVKPAFWHKIALGLAFLFVSLSVTDLCPRFLLNEWVKPYVLKAVPCIVVWVLITIDLLKTPRQKVPTVVHE